MPHPDRPGASVYRQPRYRRVVREEIGHFDPWEALITMLARAIPPYTGNRVRQALLRLAGWDIGACCTIPSVPRIIGTRASGRRLRVGESVVLGVDVLFDCAAPITVGDNTGIGHGVQLVTGNHEIGPRHRRLGALDPRPIHIGDGAWLGSGAIILPGVSVGEGAVVAAGSVVSADVPPDTLYAGIPARKVRDLA